MCRVGVYGFISRVSSGFKVLDQYDLNDTILQVRVCCAFRPGLDRWLDYARELRFFCDKNLCELLTSLSLSRTSRSSQGGTG